MGPADARRAGGAIAATTAADIRAFFDRAYRPGGAILAVAGRVDWEPLKDRVGELLGDWPAGPDDGVEESARGERYAHLAYESHQTQIGIAYESVPYRDPDYFQAWGAVGVLSGGMMPGCSPRSASAAGCATASTPRSTRSFTAARFFAMPAPGRTAPRRRWT